MDNWLRLVNDVQLASDFADLMLQEGIYVIGKLENPYLKKYINIVTFLLTKLVNFAGFSFPVVPKGKARIRVQISAAHTEVGGADKRCTH
jgi:glycine C-acetyltransferase